MKKILSYILGWAVAASMLPGCSSFLEESSQDEIRPSTTNDLAQLLLGEGYPRNSFFIGYLDLMTDDVESAYNTRQGEYLRRGRAPFTWSTDVFEEMSAASTEGITTWQDYYNQISGCNVVMDNLDKVTGSEEDKANLRGQALALRAYYYFMLVNVFAEPYNAAGVDVTTSPGVPIILESAVTDYFPERKSIAEVYARIEADLLEAAPLMEQYGTNNGNSKVTDLFVHLLLSRVYLYMERWDEVIEEADYVIKKRPNLINLSTYWSSASMNVYATGSPERIWGYSSFMEYEDFFYGSNNGQDAFFVSKDLLGIYEVEYDEWNVEYSGDLRYIYYYELDNNYDQPTPVSPFKNQTQAVRTTDYQKGFRVAEAYLNRAEANIRLYLEDGSEERRQSALADLNHLREYRFDSYPGDSDYSGEALLDFCKTERRRELSFDDHRWFDLRRYGKPALTHSFSMESGPQQTYTLEEGSSRYVLRIPQVVMLRNPALVQNP